MHWWVLPCVTASDFVIRVARTFVKNFVKNGNLLLMQRQRQIYKLSLLPTYQKNCFINCLPIQRERCFNIYRDHHQVRTVMDQTTLLFKKNKTMWRRPGHAAGTKYVFILKYDPLSLYCTSSIHLQCSSPEGSTMR